MDIGRALNAETSNYLELCGSFGDVALCDVAERNLIRVGVSPWKYIATMRSSIAALKASASFGDFLASERQPNVTFFSALLPPWRVNTAIGAPFLCIICLLGPSGTKITSGSKGSNSILDGKEKTLRSSTAL
jgi:hypothetical protein